MLSIVAVATVASVATSVSFVAMVAVVSRLCRPPTIAIATVATIATTTTATVATIVATTVVMTRLSYGLSLCLPLAIVAGARVAAAATTVSVVPVVAVVPGLRGPLAMTVATVAASTVFVVVMASLGQGQAEEGQREGLGEGRVAHWGLDGQSPGTVCIYHP